MGAFDVKTQMGLLMPPRPMALPVQRKDDDTKAAAGPMEGHVVTLQPPSEDSSLGGVPPAGLRLIVNRGAIHGVRVGQEVFFGSQGVGVVSEVFGTRCKVKANIEMAEYRAYEQRFKRVLGIGGPIALTNKAAPPPAPVPAAPSEQREESPASSEVERGEPDGASSKEQADTSERAEGSTEQPSEKDSRDRCEDLLEEFESINSTASGAGGSIDCLLGVEADSQICDPLEVILDRSTIVEGWAERINSWATRRSACPGTETEVRAEKEELRRYQDALNRAARGESDKRKKAAYGRARGSLISALKTLNKLILSLQASRVR